MTQTQLAALARTHVLTCGFKNGDYPETYDVEDYYEAGFLKALELVKQELEEFTKLSPYGEASDYIPHYSKLFPNLLPTT